jgi:hypothetical protein
MELHDDQGMWQRLQLPRLDTDCEQRVYFGNWLRDYSQVQDHFCVRHDAIAETIRLWMSRR